MPTPSGSNPSQQDLIGDYHCLRDLFENVLAPSKQAQLVVDGGSSGPIMVTRLERHVLVDFYNNPDAPPIADSNSLLANRCRVSCEDPFQEHGGFATPNLVRIKQIADVLLQFRSVNSVEEILVRPGTGLFLSNSSGPNTWGTLSVRGVFPVRAAALLCTHDISCSLLEKIASTFEAGTELKFDVGNARITFRANGKAEIDIQSSVPMEAEGVVIEQPVRKVVCYDLLEEKLVGFACYDSAGQRPVHWDCLDYESMTKAIVELYNGRFNKA